MDKPKEQIPANHPIIVMEQAKSLVHNGVDGGASNGGSGCFITEYKLQCA
jgi:hypothetical protein